MVNPIELPKGKRSSIRVADSAQTFRLETTDGTVVEFRAVAGTTVYITPQDDIRSVSITITDEDIAHPD